MVAGGIVSHLYKASVVALVARGLVFRIGIGVVGICIGIAGIGVGVQCIDFADQVVEFCQVSHTGRVRVGAKSAVGTGGVAVGGGQVAGGGGSHGRMACHKANHVGGLITGGLGVSLGCQCSGAGSRESCIHGIALGSTESDFRRSAGGAEAGGLARSQVQGAGRQGRTVFAGTDSCVFLKHIRASFAKSPPQPLTCAAELQLGVFLENIASALNKGAGNGGCLL